MARTQLEAFNWQPQPWSLDGWNRDLTVLPEEVAARTGPLSAQVNDAEQWREGSDVKEALLIYQGLAKATNLDQLTGAFVRERLATLGMEQSFGNGRLGWTSCPMTRTSPVGTPPSASSSSSQMGRCRFGPAKEAILYIPARGWERSLRCAGSLRW